MPIVPHTRTILQEAIGRGVASGLNRAFKHTDTPPREEIAWCVEDNIIAAIDEWFDVTDVTEHED